MSAGGDLAPINAADLLLIERALRGEDVDGDTLSTASEIASGTSPFRADTDGDLLTDGLELTLGTDPARSDADGDGLTDAAEIARGSDPEDRDTDGDGYLDGADTDPRGGVVYRHGDHLGSTTLTTRSDGEVIARAIYRPFGGVVPATASGPTHAPGEFGFTGQRYEKASGISDYGARFYDPALGRFLQPDTVVPGGGLDPQGLNRYAYVRNNPLSRIDPSGHWSFDFGLGFGAASYSTGQGFGWDWGPSFGASFSTGSYGNGWGGSFMFGWDDGFSVDVSGWLGSNYFGVGFEGGNAYAASQFGSAGDALGIASRELRSELGLAGQLGLYDRARDGNALSRLTTSSGLKDAFAVYDQASSSYVVSSDVGSLGFGQGRSVMGHEFWHSVDESFPSLLAGLYDLEVNYPEPITIWDSTFASSRERGFANVAKEFRATTYEARTQQHRGSGAVLSTGHYLQQYGAPLRALGEEARILNMGPRLP